MHFLARILALVALIGVAVTAQAKLTTVEEYAKVMKANARKILGI